MSCHTIDQKTIRTAVFSRSFGRSLCASIVSAARQAKADGLCALIFDFQGLPVLRSSEVAAILEATALAPRGFVFGVAGQSPLRAQLQELGVDRFVHLSAHAENLLMEPAFVRVAQRQVEAIVLAHQRCPLLGPLVQDRPAALLEFGDQTLLDRSFKLLQTMGISNVTVCVGDHADLVRDAALKSKHHDMTVRFRRCEERETGDAWRAVQTTFDDGLGWAGDAVVVDPLTPLKAPSDIAVRQALASCDPDFSAGHSDDIALCRISQAAMSFSATFPNCSLGQAARRLSRDFGAGRFANASVDVWQAQTAQGFFDLMAAHKGRFGCGADGFIRRENGAWVHRSARVHDSAVLSAETVIGPVADVRQGCCFKGPVLVERGAKVGENSFVQSSWLDTGADIPAGHWVDRMLVGRDWALDYGVAQTLPLNLEPITRNVWDDRLQIESSFSLARIA